MSPNPSANSQAKRTEALLPFTRAWNLESCQLYWIPVSGTPMPFRQKQWMLEFAQRFARVANSHQAEPQTFLQMKVIQPDLRDEFVRSSRELTPLIGLSRRPGEALPPLPDKAYAEDLAKGRVAYDPASLQPDYCYWFTSGAQPEILRKFLGSGGIVSVYLPKDEGNRMPDVKIPASAFRNPQMAQLLQTQSLDRVNRISSAMASSFLKQSKLLFGQDLQEEAMYPGLLFILPLLSSRDFFNADPRDIDTWFSLFDFYVGESPQDNGVLLATKHDIEEDLVTLLRDMRQERLEYPY